MDLLVFFLIGVLTTLSIVAIIKWHNKRTSASRVIVRQTFMFEVMKVMFPDLMFAVNNRDTQATSYEDSKVFNYIQMSDNKAYWMDKNKIYCADIKNGRFNPSEGKQIEMKNLSEKQINKTLYIFNSLKNG
jgi:hypothetical protein